MTNTKAWMILGISAVLLVVAGFIVGKSPKGEIFSAIGTNPIENYIPAILYNEGYYSALPVTTTAALTAAATALSSLTVSGDATVSGGTLAVTTSNTATSTLAVGCIQMNATSTATVSNFRLGSLNSSATSTFQGNGNGYVVWAYGACPNL